MELTREKSFGVFMDFQQTMKVTQLDVESRMVDESAIKAGIKKGSFPY